MASGHNSVELWPGHPRATVRRWGNHRRSQFIANFICIAVPVNFIVFAPKIFRLDTGTYGDKPRKHFTAAVNPDIVDRSYCETGDAETEDRVFEFLVNANAK